jgi:hypothetical protein
MMERICVRTLLRAMIMTIVASLIIPGCLLVRTTEHRIKINNNGSGEAVMRLTDIRSDGSSDSARVRDFGIMMASAEYDGAKEFERLGRKVTAKQFLVSGDTLSAEISYTFPTLESIEGLKIEEDEMFIVVPEGREIVRTNGRIQSGTRHTQRIVWSKDIRRLTYVIREREARRGSSLAAYYLEYARRNSAGGK